MGVGSALFLLISSKRSYEQREKQGPHVGLQERERPGLDFARAIFPQLSRKDSGVRVARDIAEVPPLRARMYASGYRPGKRGYTDEQIAILLEFYSLTYKKTVPVEIV